MPANVSPAVSFPKGFSFCAACYRTVGVSQLVKVRFGRDNVDHVCKTCAPKVAE